MENNKDTSFFIIIILVVLAVGATFWLLAKGSFIDPTDQKYNELLKELNIESSPRNGYGVEVKEDDSLGSYLAGSSGMTLYTTTLAECDFDCLSNWPPYIVSGKQEDSTGPLGVIKFGDSYQQTYNGSPLYYFIGDENVGDVNGHAKNGVWFVARP